MESEGEERTHLGTGRRLARALETDHHDDLRLALDRLRASERGKSGHVDRERRRGGEGGGTHVEGRRRVVARVDECDELVKDGLCAEGRNRRVSIRRRETVGGRCSRGEQGEGRRTLWMSCLALLPAMVSWSVPCLCWISSSWGRTWRLTRSRVRFTRRTLTSDSRRAEQTVLRTASRACGCTSQTKEPCLWARARTRTRREEGGAPARRWRRKPRRTGGPS